MFKWCSVWNLVNFYAWVLSDYAIRSHVKKAGLTDCTTHLHCTALCLTDCISPFQHKTCISYTISSATAYIYTFTCLLPYTLTFSHHVECKYKWLQDIAVWLSGGVRRSLVCIHYLTERGSEAESRSGPGGGRPDVLWAWAQCQQSPSSGQNLKCGKNAPKCYLLQSLS